MPECTVYTHEHRADIEVALQEGSSSLRQLGYNYGVSHSSLQRHKENHVPQKASDTATTPTETPFDWQTLIEQSHQLVVEGKNLNQSQVIIHAVRNLLKFQAHLTAAVAALAGQEMPHMPRL